MKSESVKATADLIRTLQSVSDVEIPEAGDEEQAGSLALDALNDVLRRLGEGLDQISSADSIENEADAEAQKSFDELDPPLPDGSAGLEALTARVEELESQDHVVDEADDPGSTIPEIVDETGSAGTSTNFRRDDNVPKLKLRKNGTPADISGLEVGSAGSGFQLRIAAAADEDAERAATAHDYPTIEIVPDGGAQVKLKANGGLTVDDDGIYMPAGAAGDVIYHNGTTWVVLNKDAGKYLKSGAAAVSWDTPTAASPLSVGAKQEFFRTDDHTTNGFVWKFLDGRTIGSAASGATWASADAEALFLFLWDHVSDTYCPVSGGRGASAAADWAANKTLTIPDSRGDAYGPRYAAGAHGTPAGPGTPPAVGETGGDATLQPELTVAADLDGVETDTGTANITANSEMMFPYPTPEATAGYLRVYDAGHKHPVTDIASALSGSTTAEFNVRPRYLAAGVFILAKVP